MSKWTPFQIGFDPHGDEMDREANKAFFNFAEVWKPKLRGCGGDLWNFAALRRKASEEERRLSLLDDYAAGNEWLDKFQPTFFTRGNHDERLWYLAAEKKGPISDYAAKCIGEVEAKVAKMKCTMLPYDKRHGVYQIGSLKVIHGYNCGLHAARLAAQVYGSVLMGHVHTIQHYSVEGLENRLGRACGCLCKLDMDYVSANLASLRWRHGWSYGVINERTGKYFVWQAENIEGQWILPTGYREF